MSAKEPLEDGFSSEIPNKPPLNENRHRTRCIYGCKKFTAFLFSHVGLTCLVVAWVIMGGFIFSKLETSNELKGRFEVSDIRDSHVDKLWNVTKKLNVLKEDEWKMEAQQVMKLFQHDVYRAVKRRGWDGLEGEKDNQWSFAGSILYSVTVITTIGYGNITPKTPWGRIVTILYAVVGIPLTLLCLTNIGALMASGFRLLYKKLLCGLCNRKRIRRTTISRSSNRSNDSRHQSSLKECHVDYIPGDNSDLEKNTEVYIYKADGTRRKMVRIPLVVSLVLMAGYIFGGAMLFTLWEDDWDYLVGSYFCFITLSTIGFGDYVPGTSIDSWNNQEKRILCSLYLLFGLALLAMCFNLMQEEVREKCLSVGRFLGIVDK